MGEEEGAAPPVVVLKADMHCDECALKVKRCVKKFKGVEGVMIDMANNQLTVLGNLDPSFLRDRVAAKIHREVEIVFPVISEQNKKAAAAYSISGGAGRRFCWFGWKKSAAPAATVDELNDQLASVTVVLKTTLDCYGCIKRVKKILLKVKGVKEVYVDAERQLVTVEGRIDVNSLPEHVKSKFKRHVEIVSVKIKDEKKEEGNSGAVKINDGGKDKEKEDVGDGGEVLRGERASRGEGRKEKVGDGGGSDKKKKREGFTDDERKKEKVRGRSENGENGDDIKVERFTNGERMKKKVEDGGGSSEKKREMEMDGGGGNEIKVERLASGERMTKKVGSGERMKEKVGGGSGRDKMKESEGFTNDERMKEKERGRSENGDYSDNIKVERFTNGERMNKKVEGGGGSGEKKREMEMDGGGGNEMKVERLSSGKRMTEKVGGGDGSGERMKEKVGSSHVSWGENQEEGGSNSEMEVERFTRGKRIKEKMRVCSECGAKQNEERDDNGEMKVERSTSRDRKEKISGGGRSSEKKMEMEGGCWDEMKVERALSIGEKMKKGGVDRESKERGSFKEEMNKEGLRGGYGEKKEGGGSRTHKKMCEDVSSGEKNEEVSDGHGKKKEVGRSRKNEREEHNYSKEKEDVGGYEKKKVGYSSDEKIEEKRKEKVGSGHRERRRHKYEWEKEGEEGVNREEKKENDGFDRLEMVEGSYSGRKKKERDNGEEKKAGSGC